MSERETWGTRLGFVLAAVGSAVGLGNIWRFPYVTAENGGAAFLFVYLAAVLLVGIPAMLAEFVIGRRSKRNVVNAFGELGFPHWRVIGLLGLVTGFWIVSYYSVVGGWVLNYVVASATGAYFGDPSGYFAAISTGQTAVFYHAAFMALTVGIVALGVEDGIELGTRLMVPGILVLLVSLAVWAATLDGAAAGYGYFLSPDVDVIVANIGDILPSALGQAFFSLSLGMGVMITYASYLAEDDNLGFDGVSIALLNTLVGVLAGLVTFPLLAAQGKVGGVAAGPGAIFVSMAQAFETLPGGRLLGVAFFGVVAIAALSSAISLLEVLVSYAIDNYDVRRPVAATGLGVVLFGLGVPSALQTETLTLFDTVASTLLLPLGVLLIVVFTGWVFAGEALAELELGIGDLPTIGPAWLWHLRTLILASVLVTLSLRLPTFVDAVRSAVTALLG